MIQNTFNGFLLPLEKDQSPWTISVPSAYIPRSSPTSATLSSFSILQQAGTPFMVFFHKTLLNPHSHSPHFLCLTHIPCPWDLRSNVSSSIIFLYPPNRGFPFLQALKLSMLFYVTLTSVGKYIFTNVFVAFVPCICLFLAFV